MTNTNDSGAGSLRQAILDANAGTGPESIQFAIPASNAALTSTSRCQGFDPTTQTWTINLNSPLSPITNQVTIDGYSEAHSAVPYRYPIAFSSAVQQVSIGGFPTGGTFTFTTVGPLPIGTTAPIPFNASNATIQTDLDAILGPGSVTLTGSTSVGLFFIDFTGSYTGQAIPDLVPTSALTGGFSPSVSEATFTVGGVVIASPAEISSVPNSESALSGNNAQQRIIVNGTGTGGGTGFEIDSSDSIIRGLIIEGFGVGVAIPGPNDVGDRVEGNFIGQYFVSEFDPTTGAPVPAPNTQIFTGIGNSLQGVLLGSTNAVIGGFTPQENNVIIGNGQQGVEILAGAVGNQVLGNQIGIAGPSLGGLYAIASNGSDGVLIASGSTGGSASSNVIGGATTAGAGNLISANDGNGVHIMGAAATRNLIEGNYIGVGSRRRLPPSVRVIRGISGMAS